MSQEDIHLSPVLSEALKQLAKAALVLKAYFGHMFKSVYTRKSSLVL